MKKYESYFQDDRDSIIFPLLIRSMKETKFKFNFTINKLINSCLSSRNEHHSETYYNNISYWPQDIGAHKNSFSALFLARIINLNQRYTKFRLTKLFANNFICYARYFYTDNKSLQYEVLTALMRLKNYDFCYNPLLDATIRKLKEAIQRNGNLVNNIKKITPYQICWQCLKK